MMIGEEVDTLSSVRLDEYDKTEWWDVVRRCRPGITVAEFDVLWENFQAAKAAHYAAKLAEERGRAN